MRRTSCCVTHGVTHTHRTNVLVSPRMRNRCGWLCTTMYGLGWEHRSAPFHSPHHDKGCLTIHLCPSRILSSAVHWNLRKVAHTCRMMDDRFPMHIAHSKIDISTRRWFASKAYKKHRSGLRCVSSAFPQIRCDGWVATRCSAVILSFRWTWLLCQAVNMFYGWVINGELAFDIHAQFPIGERWNWSLSSVEFSHIQSK